MITCSRSSSRVSRSSRSLPAHCPGKLVAFRDRGKDARPLRGEAVLHGAVIGARVASDVEQPQDPGEVPAIERAGDERAELAALRFPCLGVSVPRQVEEVEGTHVVDVEGPGLAGCGTPARCAGRRARSGGSTCRRWSGPAGRFREAAGRAGRRPREMSRRGAGSTAVRLLSSDGRARSRAGGPGPRSRIRR